MKCVVTGLATSCQKKSFNILPHQEKNTRLSGASSSVALVEDMPLTRPTPSPFPTFLHLRKTPDTWLKSRKALYHVFMSGPFVRK